MKRWKWGLHHYSNKIKGLQNGSTSNDKFVVLLKYIKNKINKHNNTKSVYKNDSKNISSISNTWMKKKIKVLKRRNAF